jgi:hypothetical protein
MLRETGAVSKQSDKSKRPRSRSSDSGALLDGRSQAMEMARAATVGVVGVVPFVGSPISALVEASWPSLWQRRAERLLSEIDHRVAFLETARLQRDEVVTAVAMAVRSAVVSDEAKIAYLAAAVANTATDPHQWKHDIVVVLMRIVDELTASHFRVLDLLVDPSAWIARTGVLLEQHSGNDGGFRLADDFERALRAAGQPIDDIALLLNDLESRGVLNSVGLGNESPSSTPKSIHPDLVSVLGHRVHSFVTWKDPENAE